tara:strand:+ start:497 stop:958 length:462 start_codon:yes stop_codon:yes gene_type:complete
VIISKLNHTNLKIATDIRSVFQASYRIEAKLLKATDFPPLKRPLNCFIESSNDFWGAVLNKATCGVVEINTNKSRTHIQSLVVHPTFFRQGVGRKLVEHVFDTYKTKLFTVETGLENTPALKLYKLLGFEEISQYNTDHGIRKVKLEKLIEGV